MLENIGSIYNFIMDHVHKILMYQLSEINTFRNVGKNLVFMSKINSINIWKLLKIFEKYLKNKKKIMYNLKKDINKYVNVLIDTFHLQLLINLNNL